MSHVCINFIPFTVFLCPFHNLSSSPYRSSVCIIAIPHLNFDWGLKYDMRIPWRFSNLLPWRSALHTQTPTWCFVCVRARARDGMYEMLSHDYLRKKQKLHEHAKTSVNVLSLVKWALKCTNENRRRAHFMKRATHHSITHRSNFEIDVINFKQTAKQQNRERWSHFTVFEKLRRTHGSNCVSENTPPHFFLLSEKL